MFQIRCHSFVPFRIHIETTSVLLKQFPVEYLKRPTQWKYAPNNTGIAILSWYLTNC